MANFTRSRSVAPGPPAVCISKDGKWQWIIPGAGYTATINVTAIAKGSWPPVLFPWIAATTRTDANNFFTWTIPNATAGTMTATLIIDTPTGFWTVNLHYRPPGLPLRQARALRVPFTLTAPFYSPTMNWLDQDLTPGGTVQFTVV